MVGIISVVIGGHFGGGDHFDGGNHFGGGTRPFPQQETKLFFPANCANRFYCFVDEHGRRVAWLKTSNLRIEIDGACCGGNLLTGRHEPFCPFCIWFRNENSELTQWDGGRTKTKKP